MQTDLQAERTCHPMCVCGGVGGSGYVLEQTRTFFVKVKGFFRVSLKGKDFGDQDKSVSQAQCVCGSRRVVQRSLLPLTPTRQHQAPKMMQLE